MPCAALSCIHNVHCIRILKLKNCALSTIKVLKKFFMSWYLQKAQINELFWLYLKIQSICLFTTTVLVMVNFHYTYKSNISSWLNILGIFLLTCWAQGSLKSYSMMSCTGLSCPSSPCSESGWLRVPGCGAWVLGLVRVMGWPRVSWPDSCPLQQAWAPRTHRPPGSGAECHGALCTSSESHKNNYQPMGTLKRNLQSCLAGTCQGWSESPTQFVLWVFFFFGWKILKS